MQLSPYLPEETTVIEQVMNNPIVNQLFVTFICQFFFVFGIIGFAVGIGLVVNHVRMHQFFGFINHWVSMRRSTKWLAIPRDTGAVAQRFRHLIGAAIILLSAFSLFVLVAKIDVVRLATAISPDSRNLYVILIVESVRWFLIAGSVLAIAVGVMLVFFPNVLRAIETRTNRWYSTRKMTRGEETILVGFDSRVEGYPRTMGWIIASGALVVVIYFGMLLFRHS